jgi:hypothetical protein
VRGAAIGSVAGGRITITDFPGQVETDVLVQGDGVTRIQIDENTTRYIGENMRFRVFRGKWRVRISGFGIFASVVGVGQAEIVGQGRYSLAGSPFEPWPSDWITLKLGDESDTA